MAKLLYLVHRLPYPPDKGDKVSGKWRDFAAARRWLEARWLRRY